MTLDDRIRAMSLEEKVSLLGGRDMWHLPAVDGGGVGSIRMSDGPNGVRGIAFDGPRSACAPSGSSLGATWDVDLVRRVASVLGAEAAARGVQVHLAPTVNLHRTPVGGRNFECFAEDPVLTADLGVAYVRGVQAHGVASCIKHLVANDTEFERMTISSEVEERVLREVYLLPFEDAVDAADVRAVMSSYNRVNGIHASQNRWLLTTVLRDDWGFDGLVVSDWFGTHSTGEALAAGLDVEMPGPPAFRGEKLLAAVQAGEAAEDDVDRAARRVLGLAEWTGRLDAGPLPDDRSDEAPGTRAVLREAVAAGAVLLRNERGLLPLDPATVGTVAVIGPNATRPAAHGGGSAAVRPYRVVRPLDALRGRFADVRHERGCANTRAVPPVGADLLGPDGALLEFVDPDTGEVLGSSSADRLRLFWIGRPAPGIPSSRFDLRLTATITPEEGGAWTFALTSVGASRLLIDDALVIDNLDPTPGHEFYGAGSVEVTGTVELEKGRSYRLVVEQSKDGGGPLTGLLVGAELPLADDAIDRAVDAVRAAAVAVVVAGTNDQWESEGADRTELGLPGEQDELIRRVAAVNPRTVVVLNTGSPVSMPWLDHVAAVVQLWFCGQELGGGLADVLTGDAEPSGRLPLTFPRRLEDTPAFLTHPGEGGVTHYDEELFVGHRHYDARSDEPLFPFGFGLGYGDVAYGAVRAVPATADEPRAAVEIDVTNRGSRPTYETVQAYVSRGAEPGDRPIRQLAGFTKVALAPGASATVRVALHRRHRSAWVDGRWVEDVEPVEVHVGPSSRDLRGRVTS